MSLKDFVLQNLEENRPSYVSGQQMAEMFQVSRAAVWKAIEALRRDGYEIDSAPKKGYALLPSSDILSKGAIYHFLKSEYRSFSLHVYESIDSTNQAAKKMAVDGAAEGTVIVANTQTAGRGRMGRSFYSPAHSGIYMSMILRPQTDISDTVLLTTAAGVAVCRAIESTCKKPCFIKWLNDIYLDEKKICGILTEAMTNCETGLVDSVIVGIGVNFKTPAHAFPTELQSRAVSIFSDEIPSVTRSHLIAEIVNEFMDLYADFTQKEFLKEYRSRSFVLGKQISYFAQNQWHDALALDIADNGGLIVRDKEGKIHTLHSGEITLRNID